MNAQRPLVAAPATTDLDADRDQRNHRVRRCPRGNAVVGSLVEHARLNIPTDQRDWREAVRAGIVRDRRGVRGRRRGDD
jgi:hypothetical protein